MPKFYLRFLPIWIPSLIAQVIRDSLTAIFDFAESIFPSIKSTRARNWILAKKSNEYPNSFTTTLYSSKQLLLSSYSALFKINPTTKHGCNSNSVFVSCFFHKFLCLAEIYQGLIIMTKKCVIDSFPHISICFCTGRWI